MKETDRLEFIKDNYLIMPIKTIAKKIEASQTLVRRRLKTHNLVIPIEIIEQRKKDSYFKKSHKPFNKGKKQKDYMSLESINKTKKTRFKKGQEPTNTKYDGHERITKDGYVMIRIESGQYRLKHIVEWEKVNGKIKKGYCLWCLDGNIKNTKHNNWELISRSENMYRNSKHNYPKEIIPTLLIINKINKQINNLQNGK